jgi:hypothetical protein
MILHSTFSTVLHLNIKDLVTAIWDLFTYKYVCVLHYGIIIIIIIILTPSNAVVTVRTTFPNTNKNYVFPSKYICVLRNPYSKRGLCHYTAI